VKFKIVVTANGEKVSESIAREQDAHTVGSQLWWAALGLYRNAQGVLDPSTAPEIVVTSTPIAE
jgi:hypothetical protein